MAVMVRMAWPRPQAGRGSAPAVALGAPSIPSFSLVRAAGAVALAPGAAPAGMGRLPAPPTALTPSFRSSAGQVEAAVGRALASPRGGGGEGLARSQTRRPGPPPFL